MGKLEFWQLSDRSDAAVLAGLERLVGSTRQLTVELIAHLGEVEERRLHLIAACGSMFQYCTLRLGLSEDEACRRIEVARLARRFPLLFPALARGALSLSVAALLKPHLSEGNQVELVRRLSGKSVRQAEECLAALFPRADVASSVRKLPSPVSERVAPASRVGAVVSDVASSEADRVRPDADAGNAASVGTRTWFDGTVSRPCASEAVLRSTGATGDETDAYSAERDPNATSMGGGGSGGLAGDPVLDSAPRATPALLRCDGAAEEEAASSPSRRSAIGYSSPPAWL